MSKALAEKRQMPNSAKMKSQRFPAGSLAAVILVESLEIKMDCSGIGTRTPTQNRHKGVGM
jgi:hypothetical protein